MDTPNEIKDDVFHERMLLNVGNDSHIENILTGGKSARALGVIIIVLFIGILLSFLVNFGVSAYLGSEELADSYFDGEEHPGIAFPAFADSFYLSSEVRQNILRVDYYLFSRLHSDEVLPGKNRFLFPTYDKANDYNYIADYLGQLSVSEGELEGYRDGLNAITESYAELDAECFFVIIPNSQTIYPEWMPDFIGDISSETRLKTVTKYLKERGTVNYLDLTDALLDAKEHGELYNNTEDSLNSRGAYYAYLALLDILPPEATENITPVVLNEGDLVRHTTAGKELARAAKLETVIKNRTVSLSTDFVQKYQMLLHYDEYDVAFPRAMYRDELPAFPRVALTFASDWDRIIMIDYLSNTFGTTIYMNNTSFNGDVIKKSHPGYIIIFLHERDLSKLTDGSMLPQ